MKRGEVYWLDVKSDVKHVNVGNRPVLIVSNDQSRFEPKRFCLNCGRPLTEEAWAELERRLIG